MEQHVPRPESHEPVRVAHWSPRAEQRIQPLAMCDGTARSLTLTAFGSPPVGKIFPT
ncbi:MAG: hypothetical protein LBQ54_09120 [Planctomycetaceae bacterium]|nr:hypothetical protein [Planctomycetaceae bacterium]